MCDKDAPGYQAKTRQWVAPVGAGNLILDLPDTDSPDEAELVIDYLRLVIRQLELKAGKGRGRKESSPLPEPGPMAKAYAAGQDNGGVTSAPLGQPVGRK